MKVTYSWLKDFVEIKISPQALAEKLTMAGLEVKSLEEQRGDFIFEIEVTSNRPDWLSVIGIAREAAAITNSTLRKRPGLQAGRKKTPSRPPAGWRPSLSIVIENKKDCPLYTARIIKDVTVGPPPDWLKRRLESIGCRSVNNIVDITNYVLFELGEPLHAFDLDKLSPDALIVRRAKDAERLATIDGEGKILNPGILVIADKDKPLALAGIMGGKDTEVTENTKNILLEAAIFNPVIVRRGRQGLGIQSESAYRFERGISPEIVEQASLRAAGLIEELCAGKAVLRRSSGSAKTKIKSVKLEAPAVNKILGVNIASAKVKKILNALGFKLKQRGKNNFQVLVPSYRQDINLEEDLIEEIARIFGYDNIPKSLPAVRPQVSLIQEGQPVSFVKSILTGLGLNEVITYSLMDKDLLKIFRPDDEPSAIEILNPLSKEQGFLRPCLLPSLSACVAHNLNQKQEYVNIFEIAKTFRDSGHTLKEELVLGIALSGAKSLLLEQGMIKDEAGLLHLKGILEALFERLGIKEYSFEKQQDSLSFAIYVKKEKIGIMMALPRHILGGINIKNKDVFALELCLEKAFSYAQLENKFIPLPKYPAIARDVSFILEEGVSITEVLDAMKEKGRPLLEDAKIVDYYKGKQIPPGHRGLTVSCLYRNQARTLTEAEIAPLNTLICEILTGRFGAKIR